MDGFQSGCELRKKDGSGPGVWRGGWGPGRGHGLGGAGARGAGSLGGRDRCLFALLLVHSDRQTEVLPCVLELIVPFGSAAHKCPLMDGLNGPPIDGPKGPLGFRACIM